MRYNQNRIVPSLTLREMTPAEATRARAEGTGVSRAMIGKHIYIIGKSGTGKTTYLQHNILNTAGGFCVLDPHGDLAEAVADTVDDCIYFDPIETPLGFNVLQNVAADRRHLVAHDVVSAFEAIWGDSWGPRLEWILYNSLRLLLDNNKTLLDILPLLTDETFRARCLEKASFKKFWAAEFAVWDTRYRNEAIAPVLNKVGQLCADPTLAKILGGKTTLKPDRIMDKGQRLVVNLSVGKIGRTPAHLLGALIVSAFASAAEKRAAIPEKERVPFVLFIDEFQNFATETFATILSEARKYNLFLVLSHQFIGQIPDTLRQAVFGNVATMISFRVGAEDAPLIAKELGLNNPAALSDIPNFRAYRRDGGPHDAQLFATAQPPVNLQRLEANKNHTRACYGRRI